jgi:hypothetical protein
MQTGREVSDQSQGEETVGMMISLMSYSIIWSTYFHELHRLTMKP